MRCLFSITARHLPPQCTANFVLVCGGACTCLHFHLGMAKIRQRPVSTMSIKVMRGCVAHTLHIIIFISFCGEDQACFYPASSEVLSVYRMCACLSLNQFFIFFNSNSSDPYLQLILLSHFVKHVNHKFPLLSQVKLCKLLALEGTKATSMSSLHSICNKCVGENILYICRVLITLFLPLSLTLLVRSDHHQQALRSSSAREGHLKENFPPIWLH